MGTIIFIFTLFIITMSLGIYMNIHDKPHRQRLIEIRKEILKSKTKEELYKLGDELTNIFKKGWTDFIMEE